ncbi:hypothetical protein BFP97_10940 [Roseivirga sp. 4D4]|uniref:FAD:protein FMN transferase n=1 Tax=Roseivirga sp. 4D4 TaxID=1889784 RepID=UPI0008539E48|nr:FAD:protein FMN transferase [Roseivirga sp. 4D4]OEK02003.1 hypothetical protein BFP97_10940 [Roseivirga sp. 4D4]
MKEFRRVARLMGSAFELCVVHSDKEQSETLLDIGIDEIARIEELLSEFRHTSETSKINDSAFQSAVEVSRETLALIQRALQISELTSGTFDITAARLKGLYEFKGEEVRLPQSVEIDRVLNEVGYQHIRLDYKNSTVSFNRALKINFAAIGKGYASDCVKKLWLDQGVVSGYVNASGDLNAFGSRADGSDWKVGVANPDNADEMLLYVPTEKLSAATSGDYVQFFVHNGQRYSHNINPLDGLPLKGVKSVTVLSPSAELSDALATAVYVMGSDKGIRFINQLPNTHCIIIDDRNRLFLSEGLNYEKVNP